MVFAGSSFAAHTITAWPENRKGAVSLAFDDGCQSHVSLGIPALNARGFKGSFFLVIDSIDGYSPSWASWINAANAGHEIGSHTISHPYLTSLSSSEVQNELSGSKAAIDAQIHSQQCLTFAYPYGAVSGSVASAAQSIYMASRGISCGLNSDPIDFSNVKACSPDDGDDIYAQADAAEQQQKWLVAFIHSLDGGRDCWGNWEIDMWTTYLDYLKTKNLWVGTFGAAVKYIQERTYATISVLSISSDQMVLSLTDTLDDAIYDQPLTLRSEVPSSWSTVSVQQGSGSSTEVRPVVEGTRWVIYYNAVPDRGLITLKDPQVGNPQVTALAPEYVTAGAPAFTLTVYGSNFVSGAKVRWNGSNRTTTFVSATQLQASITAADIATPATVPVTVLNPDGGVSNAMNFVVWGPAPTVTGLSPSSATAGGAAFTLTVNGSNFVSGAKVRWNGADRTTTFVSATQLRANITAADIAAPATVPVTVLNPDGGVSNAMNFEVQVPPAAYTDDFNRPNESPLKGNWATWDFGLGTLELYNNQVRSTDTNPYNVWARRPYEPYGTNQYSQMKLTSIPSTEVGGPPGQVHLMGSVINGYIFTVLNSTTAAIWVKYGTSGTDQQVGANFTGTFASGDVYKLAINGNVLTAYKNGVSLSTRTDGNNRVPSGGSPGMMVVYPGTWDDWQGGDPNGNPLPAVTGLSPAFATVAAPAFTLTVDGSNFVSGAKVRWNGSRPSTTLLFSP